jgi:hypothetical protein
MTRTIGKFLAVAAMLLGFLGVDVAQAQVVVDDDDDAVVVERRPSAMGVVARNAVGGLVLGSAVAGGIILYEMGIEDNDDYDWEETLAWGAGVGLAAGLVWGIVDATTGAATYGRIAEPVRDGHSMTLDLRRKDQSHRVSVPLLRGRF